MIVVSDTTPVISLLKIHRLELLKTLFGRVLIPSAVYRELTTNETFVTEAEAIRCADYIETRDITDQEAYLKLKSQERLDEGECEAIVLAKEEHADLLLLDERKARRVAQEMGIVMTGTIGLLMQAYDEKLLSKEDVFECLRIFDGNDIRISESLHNRVMKYIGE